MKIRQIHSSRL